MLRKMCFSIIRKGIARVSYCDQNFSFQLGTNNLSLTDGWYYSKKKCCLGDSCQWAKAPCSDRHLLTIPVATSFCPMWKHWSQLITGSEKKTEYIDYIFYVTFTVALATASSLLTMTTRTVYPGALQIRNVDEDLAQVRASLEGSSSSGGAESKAVDSAPTVYYSAAGSGVAEVKVILSGFVLHVRSPLSF